MGESAPFLPAHHGLTFSLQGEQQCSPKPTL